MFTLQIDAFEEPPSFAGGAVGKDGLGQYREKGFFETQTGPNAWGGDQVRCTLDFGFADYAVLNPTYPNLVLTFPTHQVSRTLDFGFADYAVSRAFASLAGQGEVEVNGGYEKALAEGGIGADREGLINDAKTLAERCVFFLFVVDVGGGCCCCCFFDKISLCVPINMISHCDSLVSDLWFSNDNGNIPTNRSHRAVVSMFDKERGLMMPKGSDRQPFNGGKG